MREYYERRLPHWQPPGAIVFLTFRLFGSLPRIALERLATERVRLRALPPRPDESPRDRALREGKRMFALLDRSLDDTARRNPDGPLWLRRADVAALVRQALHYGHDKRYIVHRYVIMPNHVHWLIEPLAKTERDGEGEVPGPLHRPPEYRFLSEGAAARSAPDAALPGVPQGSPVRQKMSADDPWEPSAEYWPLDVLTQSVKSFSSRSANRLLGHSGAFWQEERYDHWVRDEAEFLRIVAYMDQNPVAAGLCRATEEWAWSSAGESVNPQLGDPNR